jgi:hypothetical protein
MVAIEAGRDLLRCCRIRQQVACDLLHRELVKPLIAIERIDDPIPPAPHVSLAIELIPVGVRIPCGVEPPHCHPFAIAAGGEQPVNYLLVCIRSLVREERVDLGRRRRQSSDIEGHPANQCFAGCFGRRLQAAPLELLQHEIVDPVLRPSLVGGLRQRLPDGRNEGPMLLPSRALLNPIGDRLNLNFCQL